MSYRIRTIAQRSGVPAMTLRSWERRYGFPVPKRTGSGYRMYSDDDLRQVLAVKRMLEDGTAVSEAVERVRSMRPDSEPEAMVEALLTAAMALDDTAIERIVTQAERLLTAREFSQRIALPSLERSAEVLDIAAEHLLSAHLRAHLRQAIERIKTAGGQPIILACPSKEEHEGGLLAIALELRLRGFRTVFLGANTPPEAIGAAVKKARARAVCLSMVQKRTEKQVSEMLAAVVAAAGSVPVIVGGAAARKCLKAVFQSGASFAEDAEELLSYVTGG